MLVVAGLPRRLRLSFKDDPQWAGRAKQFVSKIKDITAILVELDFHKRNDLRLTPQIITYQDSCHLRNVMRTSSEPRMLLEAIQGQHTVK